MVNKEDCEMYQEGLLAGFILEDEPCPCEPRTILHPMIYGSWDWETRNPRIRRCRRWQSFNLSGAAKEREARRWT